MCPTCGVHLVFKTQFKQMMTKINKSNQGFVTKLIKVFLRVDLFVNLQHRDVSAASISSYSVGLKSVFFLFSIENWVGSKSSSSNLYSYGSLAEQLGSFRSYMFSLLPFFLLPVNPLALNELPPNTRGITSFSKSFLNSSVNSLYFNLDKSLN